MRILITGGTGFVGKALTFHLKKQGHSVVLTTRNPNLCSASVFLWKSVEQPFPRDALHSIDAVVHLMGESLSSLRWSKKKKNAILRSRVEATKALVEAIQCSKNPPKVFIAASAIGIYGNRNNETLDENSALGNDFLANVCKDWEQASIALNETNVRRVILRFGLVMSPLGGFEEKIRMLCKFGLTSPLGNGKQWVSTIQLENLIALIWAAISDTQFSGVCNAVDSCPVTNRELMRSFAKQAHRPLLPAIPAIFIRLLLGKASSLVLNSQRVISIRGPQ